MDNGRIFINYYNGCPVFYEGILEKHQYVTCVRGGYGNRQLYRELPYNSGYIESGLNYEFVNWWLQDRGGKPICFSSATGEAPYIWLQIDMVTREVYASFENQFGDDWMPLRTALDKL